MTPDMPERRYDVLSRSEFLDTASEIREDIKEILRFQRETNSKVATAFERLGVLEERTAATALIAARLATVEERTQNLRDNPARMISVGSFAVALIMFVLSILKR